MSETHCTQLPHIIMRSQSCVWRSRLYYIELIHVLVRSKIRFHYTVGLLPQTPAGAHAPDPKDFLLKVQSRVPPHHPDPGLSQSNSIYSVGYTRHTPVLGRCCYFSQYAVLTVASEVSTRSERGSLVAAEL